MYVLLQSVLPALQQAPPTQAFTGDFLDTHRQVSCGLTVPFSWVLVHKVLWCPRRVYFPVLCGFWQLYGGVNGDLLQEDLCHTHTQSPCPCGRPLPTCTSTGDAHSSVSVSVGSLGPDARKVCLCPPRVYSPVLCKFWQLYGGVNGDLLQENVCHTQVCCTQSPCP